LRGTKLMPVKAAVHGKVRIPNVIGAPRHCSTGELIMRTDSEIKRDVEDELEYDPDVDSTDIGVSVKDGVVTLTGFARSYSQKLQAEADAKRVTGVKAVANDIEVRLVSLDSRPDPDIARDVVAQLKLELPLSHERIKSVVK